MSVAHVDLADVDQPARAEHEFQEALAVGAQRDLVVDAGRHVAEMRGRHACARITGSKSNTLIASFGLLIRSSVLSGAHMMRSGSLVPGDRSFAGESLEARRRPTMG